jgi:hypothetical protein
MSQALFDDADELAEASADPNPVGSSALVGMHQTARNGPTVKAPAGDLLFVTPDGAWVREESKQFFVALGDSDPDYDAPLFAIKNLGFIAVRVSSKSLCDLKLHPRNVTSKALCSVYKLLQSTQCELFRITYFIQTWTSEITTSPARMICRLSEICAREEVGLALRAPTSLVH